jgi:hypothetical protein
MGTWGPALFSDDTACDLREDFRSAIADGLSAAADTDRILAEYHPDPADSPYAATVWLAIAVTQWKLGRLEERVRDEALAAIDGGGARATPAYLASLHKSFAATPDLAIRMSRIMLLGLKAHTLKGRFRPLGIRRPPPQPPWPTSGNAVLLKNFDDYLRRVLGFR